MLVLLLVGALTVLTRVARDAKSYQVLFSESTPPPLSVLLVVDMELREWLHSFGIASRRNCRILRPNRLRY